MHGANLNIAAPRAASPVTFWSNARPTGVGVFGITHSGSFERGYVALDVSLTFITGVSTGAFALAAAGVVAPVLVASCATGVVLFLPVSAAAGSGGYGQE